MSHHIHCNDEAFDEDVFSSFPLLRFDDRMPQMWWHKYQHMYMVSWPASSDPVCKEHPCTSLVSTDQVLNAAVCHLP